MFCGLQWAYDQGIDVRILSDCNSVFISHILTGAKINTRVQEVITNFSSFVRCQPPTGQDCLAQSPHKPQSAHSDAESTTAAPSKVGKLPFPGGQRAAGAALGDNMAGAKAPASHRMVIQPRHDWTVSSHGCPLCPANLCKASFLLLGLMLVLAEAANASLPLVPLALRLIVSAATRTS